MGQFISMLSRAFHPGASLSPARQRDTLQYRARQCGAARGRATQSRARHRSFVRSSREALGGITEPERFLASRCSAFRVGANQSGTSQCTLRHSKSQVVRLGRSWWEPRSAVPSAPSRSFALLFAARHSKPSHTGAPYGSANHRSFF